MIAATVRSQLLEPAANLPRLFARSYLQVPFLTSASRAAQAEEKSGVVATLAQPVPQGVAPESHQIRQ